MMIKCDRIFRFVYMCFGLLEADMICLCILRSCCRCATEMFEQNMYPITLICVHRIRYNALQKNLVDTKIVIYQLVWTDCHMTIQLRDRQNTIEA